MKEKSDFGRGLTYCIGLFLAHANLLKDSGRPRTWFNGASDHLHELDTSLLHGNSKLSKEINEWVEKILKWGPGFQCDEPTEEDVTWSLEKAIEFLRQIDEKLLKIKTVKGTWE